jgi:hypothetical protein
VADTNIALKVLKLFNAVHEAESLSVVEPAFVDCENPEGFLAAVLERQESNPNVVVNVVISAHGSDDATTFPYFCHGSMILSRAVE